MEAPHLGKLIILNLLSDSTTDTREGSISPRETDTASSSDCSSFLKNFMRVKLLVLNTFMRVKVLLQLNPAF